MQSSYLLVTHGSRDPRPQAVLEKLALQLSKRLTTLTNSADSEPDPGELSRSLVGTGTLELGLTSLNEQITRFSEQTLSTGLTQVQLLPLFLLPGVHVKEDIPAAVNLARQSVGQKLHLDLRPHLGIHPGLSRLIANQMAELPVETWILLAHGSRRSGGNAPVEAIAGQLEAIPAYWSVAPRLKTRVAELAATGYRRIGVMPYFLFPGSTTDAIAQEVARLKGEFPQVKLELATPLEPGAELVNLILDLSQLPATLSSASLV